MGQWSFRFAERNARRVLAVEYAQGLAEIGRKEARDRGLEQVEFHTQAAEALEVGAPFDLVFISGPCAHPNDDGKTAFWLMSRGFCTQAPC
ncbi:class I SAM-dependent methyltransferase [Castellaniella sp.]|uniref:class I SAM-dependent methyltransferase n=1 Tax=Castellaniella sp. TaxID=1955812 RepID=UPI003A4C658B